VISKHRSSGLSPYDASANCKKRRAMLQLLGAVGAVRRALPVSAQQVDVPVAREIDVWRFGQTDTRDEEHERCQCLLPLVFANNTFVTALCRFCLRRCGCGQVRALLCAPRPHNTASIKRPVVVVVSALKHYGDID
jgi:hypothetical protein